MMNNSATVLNLTTGSISDLDNLNLLSQLADGQRQSILLCTGNCNCINHLRQSMTNHPTVNSTTAPLPESSSTATTSSTLNSSNVNTFTTTIEDERPSGTNRTLIVETNFTSFSNRPNLYSEAGEQYNDNPSLVIDDESNHHDSNKEPPAAADQPDSYPPDYPSDYPPDYQPEYPPDYNLDSVTTTNLQAINADLEQTRNGSTQLNRSSTFNDLQSYLRNYLQNR